MSNRKMLKTYQGFTLIELMIVVAIVGILAAIAYPSYMSSIVKSNRADAKAGLSELSGFMERTYTTTGCYNPGADLICGNADDATPPVLPFTVSPKQGTTTYNLSLAAVASATYTLQAVPVTTESTCGTLSLTSTGAKSSTSGTVAECW